VGVELFRA